MDTVEYPTLGPGDRSLVDRYAVGLGTGAARVLAYLQLRADYPGAGGPATRLEIRIGTGLSRGAVGDALDRLAAHSLVTETSVRRHENGRPPQAWTADVGAAPRRTYERHAETLLDGTPASGASASTLDEPFTVALNWEPNALHAPLYAGIETGHYGDGGLDAEFDPRTGSAAALEAVAAGETDAALVGAATFVAGDHKGVVPLALLYERAMAVLYTTHETFGEPFDRVDQLRGKRVGVSAESETARLARLLLSQVDTLDDVEIVDVGGEEHEALRSGRVDAVTGQVSDVVRTDDAAVDAIPVAEQFPLYGPVLAATEETLARRPDAVRSFLVGTMCGWADAAESPAEAAACVPGVDPAVDADAGEIVARATAEFGFDRDHGWGVHDEAGWVRVRTALQQVERS